MRGKRPTVLILGLIALAGAFWGCFRLAQHVRQDQLNRSLLRAARTGDSEFLQRVIGEGAQVNVRDHEPRNAGGTPLSYAAAMCDEAGVRLLLERGADVHTRDKGGWTPLMWAVSSCDGNPKMVADLLAHGAEVNARCERTGETPLSLATARGHKKTLRLLEEAGAEEVLSPPTQGAP